MNRGVWCRKLPSGESFCMCCNRYMKTAKDVEVHGKTPLHLKNHAAYVSSLKGGSLRSQSLRMTADGMLNLKNYANKIESSKLAIPTTERDINDLCAEVFDSAVSGEEERFVSTFASLKRTALHYHHVVSELQKNQEKEGSASAELALALRRERDAQTRATSAEMELESFVAEVMVWKSQVDSLKTDLVEKKDVMSSPSPLEEKAVANGSPAVSSIMQNNYVARNVHERLLAHTAFLENSLVTAERRVKSLEETERQAKEAMRKLGFLEEQLSETSKTSEHLQSTAKDWQENSLLLRERAGMASAEGETLFLDRCHLNATVHELENEVASLNLKVAGLHDMLNVQKAEIFTLEEQLALTGAELESQITQYQDLCAEKERVDEELCKQVALHEECASRLEELEVKCEVEVKIRGTLEDQISKLQTVVLHTKQVSQEREVEALEALQKEKLAESNAMHASSVSESIHLQLKQCEDKLSASEEREAELHKKVDKWIQLAQDRQRDLSELQLTSDNLRMQVENHQATIQSLRQDQLAVQQRCERAEEKATRAEEVASSNYDRAIEAEALLAPLQSELKTLMSTRATETSALHCRLEELLSEMNAIKGQATISDFEKARADSASEKAEAAMAENNDLRVRVGKLDVEMEALRTTEKDLREQVRALSLNLSSETETLAQYRKRSAELELNLSSLTEAHQRLEEQFAATSAREIQLKEQVASLQTSLDDVSSEFESTKAAYSQVEKRKEVLERDNLAKSDSVHSLTEKVSIFESELQELRALSQTQRSQLQEKTELAGALEISVQELTAQRDEYRRNLEELQAAHSLLSQAHRELGQNHVQKVNHLASEIESFTSESIIKSQQLQESLSRLQALQKQNEQFENAIQERDDLITSLEAERNDSNEENVNLRTQLRLAEEAAQNAIAGNADNDSDDGSGPASVSRGDDDVSLLAEATAEISALKAQSSALASELDETAQLLESAQQQIEQLRQQNKSLSEEVNVLKEDGEEKGEEVARISQKYTEALLSAGSAKSQKEADAAIIASLQEEAKLQSALNDKLQSELNAAQEELVEMREALRQQQALASQGVAEMGDANDNAEEDDDGDVVAANENAVEKMRQFEQLASNLQMELDDLSEQLSERNEEVERLEKEIKAIKREREKREGQ